MGEMGRKAYLLGPSADAWLVGGASILLAILYWLFTSADAPVYAVAWIIYYLNFVANWPHFLSSYQLLYGDYRTNILKKPRFFWAAVIAPILLVGIISWGIASKNPNILGHFVQFLLITVGWHYTKQVFGIMIVTSAKQKYYFSKAERVLMKASLFSLWFLAWSHGNIAAMKLDYHGLQYFALELPEWTVTVGYVLTIGTFLTFVGMLIQRYLLKGEKPALSGTLCYLSIYFWYIPLFIHPFFIFFIPLFHSLQYLLFVGTLKKNKIISQLGNLSGAERRISFLRKFAGFYIFSCLLGAAGFLILPSFLDKKIPQDAILFGPTLWIAAFDIFINVHHYFIDNVIWRRENSDLQNFLVSPVTTFPI